MGYLIILAPILLQITCVIHAVRSGRMFPWIYVIVFLPLVGCIAYLVVELIPEWMGTRGAHKLKKSVRDAADPGRAMREALREAEMTGSIDARRKLAEQHLAHGNAAEAVALYRGMLDGQFREDPVLWLGLARAQFASGDAAGTQASLDALQQLDPKFQSGDAHLLYARALEAQGKDGEALDEYRRLVRYFSGEEARCRYGLLLDRAGRRDEARAMFEQVSKSLTGAPRHYRQTQKEWGEIAARALRA